MDVDKLEGRELDAAVAEARGWKLVWDDLANEYLWDTWKWRELPDGRVGSGCRTTLPHFSTDIAAAWELVEEMRKSRLLPSVKFTSDGQWDADCLAIAPNGMLYVHSVARGDTAPTAICRAYLKAKEAQ